MIVQRYATRLEAIYDNQLNGNGFWRYSIPSAVYFSFRNDSRTSVTTDTISQTRSSVGFADSVGGLTLYPLLRIVFLKPTVTTSYSNISNIDEIISTLCPVGLKERLDTPDSESHTVLVEGFAIECKLLEVLGSPIFQSFYEDLAVIRSADILIAPHGPGLMYAAMMKKGSHLVEIASRSFIEHDQLQSTYYNRLYNDLEGLPIRYWYIVLAGKTLSPSLSERSGLGGTHERYYVRDRDMYLVLAGLHQLLKRICHAESAASPMERFERYVEFVNRADNGVSVQG